MKIELNLIDNSYDYLKESYKYFIIADEKGVHEEKFSDYERKVKWKMAYVNLVQAFELLVKEGLYSISSILIYENIDSQINYKSRTVTGSKGIERLANCNIELLDNENKGFIKECIIRRNRFMHYDVKIDSAEIKPSYCKLFEIYISLHNLILQNRKDEFMCMISRECSYYKEILNFADNFIVFRNEEMRIEDREALLREISAHSKKNLATDEEGEIYNRIAYGNELGFDSEEAHEYCPDCTAAIGEYHYELCDIEICPKCGGQLLSCNCELINLEHMNQ